MSPRATFLTLFAIGAVIGLVGDAAHVQAGITEYLWEEVPTVWKSAVWFPLMVGSAVAVGGLIGSKFGLPRSARTRSDAFIGVGLILAMYCLTTVIAGSSLIAANGLMWGLAIAIWLWWDASVPALIFGLVAAALGPLAEILVVALGASQYLPGYDELFGVASWLAPLYFATGAVLSGIWRAIAGEQPG